MPSRAWRMIILIAPLAAACASFDAPATADDAGTDGGAGNDGGGASGDGGVDCTLLSQHSDTTFSLGDYTLKVHDAGLVEHSNDDRKGAGGGSLHARMSANTGNDREAQVSKTFDVPAAKARFEFWTKLGATGFASAGCVLMLRAANDATTLDIRSIVATGQLRFDVTPVVDYMPGGRTQANAVGAADLSKWYDVVYDVTAITSATAHVRITVDGVSAMDRDFQLPAPMTSLRLKCGIDQADENVNAEAYVDDIDLQACAP